MVFATRTLLAPVLALLLIAAPAFAGIPSVTIDAVEGETTHSGSGTLDVTITFSEAVGATGSGTDDFVQGDLTLSGCSVDSFTETTTDTVWTVTLTGLGAADCTVDVGANVATSTIDNTHNTAASQYVFTFGPSITISTTSGNDYHNAIDALEIDFTLSHSTSDFAIGDITASGCTLDNFAGSGVGWTVDATPEGNGVCTISVAAGAFTDSATSTDNLVSNTLNLYKGTPSVVIDTTDNNVGTHDGSTGINMRVTFGSPVSADGGEDFTVDDITISGGTISSFTEASGSNEDKQWTFVATPTGTSNMQMYIASGVAKATDSGAFNTPSNIVTYVYTTQWGLVSLASASSHASRGAKTVSASVDGTTSTVELENHKFHSIPGSDDLEGVKVCLNRAADADISAAALDGALTVQLTVSTSSLTDVLVNADEDDDTGTGSATYGYDQEASSALSTSGTFEIKWGDAETGDKCFYVGRTAWASDADDACTIAATSLTFGIEAYTVEGDDCSTGTDCSDNTKYFTNGMDTIVISKAVDTMPTVEVLGVADMVALFDAADAPPSPNDFMYAQDEPKRLLVLRRNCVGEYGSATDTASSFFSSSGDVTLTLATALSETGGAEGIASNVEWYDVTDNYVDTDTTWTTMQDLTGESTITELSWSGITCGSSSYQYLLAHFHNGDGSATLDSPEQATFDIDLSNAVNPDCAESAVIAQDPAIVFSIVNDPTRDATIFDTGAATNPIDLRVWFGSPSLSGSDFTVDVAQRLHLAADEAKEALHIVGLGNGFPTTGAGYRFVSTSVDDMCTSLSSTFEADMVTGDVTVDNLFDAIFAGSTAYQSSATADADYGDTTSLTITDNPFYPWNSGTDQDVISTEWTAIDGSSTAGELCYLNGEATTGKYCAKHTIAGTLSELRACKNYDGTDVLTVVNDEDAGTATYTLKVFSQVISYRGTDPDDRDWEEVQLETKTFTFSFDTNVVTSIWTDSAAVAATIDLLNVQTETCLEAACDYTADGGYMDIASTHPCDCGGDCSALGGVHKRLMYQVMVDIPRVDGRETGGDVGIRDTIHTAFQRADQTGSETCYGLETSAALSDVQFVDDHDSISTVNRYILTIRTRCISQYNTDDAANSPNVFLSCDDGNYIDNFDIKVTLAQLRTPGQSWAAALAGRVGDSAFLDAGTIPLSIRMHYSAPVGTASIGTGSTAAFTAITGKLFKDPDYQDGGVWQQESSAADLTSSGNAGGAVTFLETDRAIVSVELTHAATKDVLVLHIKDVAVATFNPASKYYNCIHPGSLNPSEDGTKYGANAGVTQVDCPNDQYAHLQYVGTALAWEEYIDATYGGGSGSNISPVSQSWGFVKNYAPEAPWADETGAEQAFLCRYGIKSSAQKLKPGSTAFFCGGYNTADNKCGADSSAYTTAAQSGMQGSQWKLLEGFGASNGGTPIEGSDAVEVPLAALPTGQALGIFLEMRAWDCGDGSEHDGGGRRLMQSFDMSGRPAMRGARALETEPTFTSTAGSSSDTGTSMSVVVGVIPGSGSDDSFISSPGGVSVLVMGIGLVIAVVAVAIQHSGCCFLVGAAKRRRKCNDDEESQKLLKSKGSSVRSGRSRSKPKDGNSKNKGDNPK